MPQEISFAESVLGEVEKPSGAERCGAVGEMCWMGDWTGCPWHSLRPCWSVVLGAVYTQTISILPKCN